MSTEREPWSLYDWERDTQHRIENTIAGLIIKLGLPALLVAKAAWELLTEPRKAQP